MPKTYESLGRKGKKRRREKEKVSRKENKRNDRRIKETIIIKR